MGCRDMCCYVPRRYVMVLMTSLGMMVTHGLRINVAVTVVTILDAAPHEKVGTIEAIASLPNVNWGAKQIGFLHAVFYIGYAVTQLPAGYLSTKLPSHWLFGLGALISSSLNFLLPVSINKFGYATTCVVRSLQGLSEGLLYPCSYAIMRHWTTPEERSKLGSIIIAGTYLGPVLYLPLAGYLTHYIGWHYVYYVGGVTGIIWFMVWFFVSYENPASHPSIDKAELKFIQDRQGESAIIYEHDSVPWKDILTSMPVHALNICNFARSFVFYLLLTNEPLYLNVFGFDIGENGLLSSIPHMAMVIVAAGTGPVADLLIADPMLTRTQVRKLFTCVGFGAEAFSLFCLYYISNGIPALIFLTVGVGFSGATISGWQINHLDLAPRYASILVAISTCAGTVAGIVLPLIVGEMTEDQTIPEWQRVFLMTSCILAVAVIFYLIFGSAEKMVWAEPQFINSQQIKPSSLSGTPFKTVESPLQTGPDAEHLGLSSEAANNYGTTSSKLVQPPTGGNLESDNPTPANMAASNLSNHTSENHDNKKESELNGTASRDHQTEKTALIEDGNIRKRPGANLNHPDTIRAELIGS